MKLGRFGSAPTAAAPPRAGHARSSATPNVCLQCGMAYQGSAITFCRRCGLPLGSAPRVDAALPTCPTCYATVADDGTLVSLRQRSARVDLVGHMAEHDQFPVGDDDYLESLRAGDMLRIGRWQAPFDLVRRYLVTGALDGGRNRAYQHSAIVNAMAQLARWGPDADIFGDQAEWKAARSAVSDLMERYQRGALAPT